MVSIGLAPGISVSVLSGLFRRGGFFERTPKFGVKGKETLPRQAARYRQPGLPYCLLNAAFFAYSLFPLLFAYRHQTWYALPLFALFPAGFLLSLVYDLSSLRLNASKTSAR
jgi:hypothetical protein